MKYFKRLSEEPPNAGATEYFEAGDDLSVVRCVVVSAGGKAQVAPNPREPLKEEDFSLSEIEAAEFNAAAGRAKPG